MAKVQSPGKKAVFLDRDGTINLDPGYLSHPDQMQLLPGVGEALSTLKKAGFELVVVTNQSGVARGLIQLDVLPKIHQRLDELLSVFGTRIDLYTYCTHHPDDACECRKPKPKLIRDAADQLGIDLRRSYMVGDRASDLEAGKAAQCIAAALVRTGDGKISEAKLQPGTADFVADSLLDVVRWIVDRESANS